MLLTDPAVQYWSCVVAVLATLAVLMLWNRVRGPRVVKGLSRFGLLLGGYVTTAVAVLVSVNIAYGGLVVSVDDLFADINPPMGQFMHHHKQCGAAGSASAEAEASAAVDASGAPAAAHAPDVPAAPDAAGGAGGDGPQIPDGAGAQPPQDGAVGADSADGQGADAQPWGPPCPQSSDPVPVPVAVSVSAPGSAGAVVAPQVAPPQVAPQQVAPRQVRR
jgi:hypothetical protein